MDMALEHIIQVQMALIAFKFCLVITEESVTYWVHHNNTRQIRGPLSSKEIGNTVSSNDLSANGTGWKDYTINDSSPLTWVGWYL